MTGHPGDTERASPSQTSVKLRGGRPPAAIGAALVAIGVIVAAVVVRGFPPTDSAALATASAGPTMSTAPLTSPASSTNPTDTPPSPDASEVPPPSAEIPGEVPGPDATVPPGSALLPNVTVDELAAAAASLGMECSSSFGGPPGWSGGFQLGCEGEDASGQARFELSALYWKFDGVVSLKVVVLPLASADIDPSLASQLLVPIALQVGGDAAREWVASKIGDTACHEGCDFTDSDILLNLSVAESGFHLLHFDQASAL